MAAAAQIAGSKQHLAGGSFYGSVLGRQSVGGGIFTELTHSRAPQVPPPPARPPVFLPVLRRRLRREVRSPRRTVSPIHIFLPSCRSASPGRNRPARRPHVWHRSRALLAARRGRLLRPPPPCLR